MSNDLSVKKPVSQPVISSMAERQDIQRGNTPALQAPHKVDLHPVEKSSIQFDPKEMRDRIREALHSLNEQMNKQNRNLNFSYDEVLDKPVVVVKSSDTGEVIRQIPNETFLKVAHSIEAMKGLLKDQQI